MLQLFQSWKGIKRDATGYCVIIILNLLSGGKRQEFGAKRLPKVGKQLGNARNVIVRRGQEGKETLNGMLANHAHARNTCRNLCHTISIILRPLLVQILQRWHRIQLKIVLHIVHNPLFWTFQYSNKSRRMRLPNRHNPMGAQCVCLIFVKNSGNGSNPFGRIVCSPCRFAAVLGYIRVNHMPIEALSCSEGGGRSQFFRWNL
mmetsp:Transcript_22733/g.41096  ORF Transcript_22733/g.41096 Transcript_22733/m.41096 type:complete len:203 (-) Transcript_22733:630-1238(-)